MSFNLVYAQNLQTYTKYYDYFKTRKQCVYHTLPDGTWHGEAKYYTSAGDPLYARTFKNGRCVYHKTFFRDGSIEEEGATFLSHVEFYKYKSYAINRNGQRVLDMEYEMDQKTRILKYYKVYDPNTRKLLYKCTASSDLKTARYTKYKTNGSIAIDVIYNLDNNTVQINTLDIGYSRYEENLGTVEYKVVNGVISAHPVSPQEKEKYSLEDAFLLLGSGIGENRQLFDPTNKNKIASKKLSNTVVNLSELEDNKIGNMSTFYTHICDINTDVHVHYNLQIRLYTRYHKPGYFDANYESSTLKRILNTWKYECMMPVGRWLYLPHIDQSHYFTYVGDFDGANATGNGIASNKYESHPNGAIITGEFKDNLPINGVCIWHKEDGTPERKYVGSFENGALSGEGEIFKYESSDTTNIIRIYKGGFKDGLYEGHGVLHLPNGDTYEGAFVQSKYHGKGVLKSKDGYVYDGEFKDGLYEGHGVLRWSNGDTYEGLWRLGKLNGKGIFSDRNVSYEGLWDNNVLINDAVITDASKNKYRVKFDQKIVNTSMVIEYANGDKYEGSVVDGSYRVGTYYFENGNIVWYTGKKIKYLTPERKSAKKKDYINWIIQNPNASLLQNPKIPQL